MFLNTTSTEMPPTSICLVFMLLEDDLEDAFDLIMILQNSKQRSLDRQLTGLNSAPIIGADILDSSIDLQCPQQRRIAGHDVVTRSFANRGTTLHRFH